MNDHEYRSNSNKAKDAAKNGEEIKVPVVVKHAAKTKKKSGVSKLADIFTPGDVTDVKSYIIEDVLIPAVKKAISDIVKNGIDMIMYGGKSPNRNRTSSEKVSYRNYYDDRRDDYRRPSGVRRRFDFDDIIFETRGEAEAVLDQMYDTIKEYGFVTVAAMYDMADLTQPFTSNKYAWTSLHTAEVVRDRDGYIIKLPKAMPID